MNNQSNYISKRYDFLLLFDVKNGNPNGDPDAGNMPRTDPETGKGLVTDTCLKRKSRNYILEVKQGVAPYDIFIKEKAILNNVIENSYKEAGIDLTAPSKKDVKGKGKSKEKKANTVTDEDESDEDVENDKDSGTRKSTPEEVERVRQLMCDRYYDIRTFGGVLSTGVNGGQVIGPVQITFAESIDPINPIDISITRMAVATVKESEKQNGGNRTFGKKQIVPYGLYKAAGFISPSKAERIPGRLSQGTGFSEEDLELMWESLENMFEYDRSAARGLMTTRALVIFEHDSRLGGARASDLFSRLKIERINADKPAREYSDYQITLDGKVLEDLRTIVRVP